ncbi:MAG: trxA2 [Candidatus Doudnabacteria bacterium]|nr:trxA2 [Candidatus Doudnabacteria bacterium]
MDLKKENFDQEVLHSEQPVIVDFWAEWCVPCKALSPTVEEIGTEFAGKAKVFKVNVDDETELQMKYGIMSIPTLKFFKNGQIVGEIVGAYPKATIVAELNKHL